MNVYFIQLFTSFNCYTKLETPAHVKRRYIQLSYVMQGCMLSGSSIGE